MTSQTRGLPGFSPPLLIVIYLGLALAPVGMAYGLGLPPRPFMDDLSSGLALVGFAMLLLEFVLSGRFKTASGRIGIDITMRFHQLMARALVVFLLIHPFLYTTPITYPLPWDQTAQLSLQITTVAMITGVLAWLGLPLLVLWAMFIHEFDYRYEVWRVCHGLGAGVIALLGLHHALSAGRYSGYPLLQWFWVVLAVIAMLTLLQVYVLGPLRQTRHPYRVIRNQQIADKTWELVIEPDMDSPEPDNALSFLPGQFVWLTLDKPPFSVREHPFSISSAPAERPQIGFTIKEMGDFTNTIGSLPVGTRAYLDGPHGHLVLHQREEPGVVFIAGGSGLAPIMSMLRQCRVDHERRPLRLIYGNRHQQQILYQDELGAIQNELDLQIDLVLGEPPADWGGQSGRIDRPLLEALLSEKTLQQWLFVVCGPAAMIDGVEHSLTQAGVPLGHIISEKFSQL